MRKVIAVALIVAQASGSTLAFAQTVAPATATTTQTTTTVTPVTPTQAGTTTTTQAAVDTTEAPPMTTPSSGGSESVTYVNRPILATGLFLWVATYAPAIAFAAENGRPSDNPNLYIPFAGPWIDLGQRDCSPAVPCSNETQNKALLIADGIGQDLSALIVLTSFFVPERRSRSWFTVGKSDVRVMPNPVGTGYGVAALGHF